MIDLRLLQHFEAVYRLESFSKAADNLNLTHSAITKSIKSLEEKWEVQLFHRTTRTVAPTEAAKRLYPMAIDLLEFAETTKRETKQGEHILNIICGPGILETILHSALLRFRETYPATRINAETKPPLEAINDIVQRRAHLLLYHSASIAGLPQTKRLSVQKLFEEPYYLICQKNHPVTESDRTLGSILKYDWAIAGFDQSFAANLPADIRSVLAQHDYPKYRLLSQNACVELVKGSEILTAVPEHAAKNLMNSGLIDGFPLGHDFRFSVSAATLIDSAKEPTVAQFVSSIMEQQSLTDRTRLSR